MLEFVAMAQHCAPGVNADTIARIVRVESSFNPFAIGVVGGQLVRQPRSIGEAVATADWLQSHGFNYSVGIAQVNQHNLSRYGLTLKTAFETCPNLHAGGEILKECYGRALQAHSNPQTALRDAISCYYSGNFSTGYRAGYVTKVVEGSGEGVAPIPLKKSNAEQHTAQTPVGPALPTDTSTNATEKLPRGTPPPPRSALVF